MLAGFLKPNMVWNTTWSSGEFFTSILAFLGLGRFPID
jgi:hypothetical protein